MAIRRTGGEAGRPAGRDSGAKAGARSRLGALVTVALAGLSAGASTVALRLCALSWGEASGAGSVGAVLLPLGLVAVALGGLTVIASRLSRLRRAETALAAFVLAYSLAPVLAFAAQRATAG